MVIVGLGHYGFYCPCFLKEDMDSQVYGRASPLLHVIQGFSPDYTQFPAQRGMALGDFPNAAILFHSALQNLQVT